MGSSQAHEFCRVDIPFSSEDEEEAVRRVLKEVGWILEKEESVNGRLVLLKEEGDPPDGETYRWEEHPPSDGGEIDDPYLNALREARSMAEGYLIEPEFLVELKANDVTENGLRNYRVAVQSLSFLGKDPRDVTKTDLVKWSLKLREEHAESTAYKYRIYARRYFKWLRGNGKKGGGYPDCVKWMEIGKQPEGPSEEILSRKEIAAMVDAAERQRDRTMVRVGYESGARVGELLGLEIGDIEFDRYGARITVDGKTGKREIRLVESAPELEKWLGVHPMGKDPNAPLCWSQKGGSLARYSLSRILKKLASRAGIEKRVHPHLLRHSRATHLVEEGLSEAQLKKIFGWTRNSETPSVYVHLSRKDADEAILNLQGTDSDPSKELSTEKKRSFK